MERSAVTPDAAGQSTAPRESGVPRDPREYPREAWEMAMRRNRVVRWFVSWLPRRATIVLRAALRWEHSIVAKVRQRWHRSLQLRVISTTLVISATMVAVLGFFLTEQIADGLLANAESNAHSQALAGLYAAQSVPGFSTEPATNSAAEQFMAKTAQTLQQQAGSSSPTYYVVVALRPDGTRQTFSHAAASTVRPDTTLPAKLRADVVKEQLQTEQQEAAQQAVHGGNLLYYAPTTLAFTDGRPSVAAIALGAPLGQYYELYFVFPLQAEQSSLQIVQTTLIGAGIALVALLAAIASLVTRWVVVPVRHAAQAAQRLSAGHLGERMTVGGADDLGKLATSFNDMAATLQGQLRELEDLSKAQRQFVSDVSHELRTPMTTIRMAAEILFDARDQLDAAESRSVELLQSQIERFEGLLTELLEISRHDANVATLDAEPTDICDLARRSADDAQQLAERRGGRIEFRLPAGPCIAEVDKRRVDRILRNLLVNAVEHGEGKDVLVTVAADRDAVAVAVRDHGVGLTAGQEQLVFERFWRADPARARTTGGTGLGLAIALEDAHLHGGWLQAWGEVGHGSVFRLTVPRLAGHTLAGSPLPLGPDEADVVTAAVEATLAVPPSLTMAPGLGAPPGMTGSGIARSSGEPGGGHA
ncbi:MAG TPA: MtrAB system histidine kinase MtrB [Trebonia sp.]|jgi:two-component system sensor histidine kinase MtrB|nr:MtrAB system histidine kinase MtrB [Trebonia sp.]